MNADLRALAERSKSTAEISPDAWYRAGEMGRLLSGHTGHAAMAEDDAEFIAATSPNAVLALLDRIKELERVTAFVEDVIVHRPCGSEWYADALKQLIAVNTPDSKEAGQR